MSVSGYVVDDVGEWVGKEKREGMECRIRRSASTCQM